MAAPQGNSYWTLRSSSGRKPIFETPQKLWKACVKYFQWCEDHPLQQEEIVKYKDSFERIEVSKMRAMTKRGLCLHLGIDQQTFENYKERGEDFLGIVTRVEDIIFEQKFTGAAADLLNSSIISRELGLIDKTEQKHGVSDDLKEMFDRIDGASKGLAGLRGETEEPEMEAEQPLLDRG
nr:terminase small subunit [uncultured Cohaesibacter sp.]